MVLLYFCSRMQSQRVVQVIQRRTVGNHIIPNADMRTRHAYIAEGLQSDEELVAAEVDGKWVVSRDRATG